MCNIVWNVTCGGGLILYQFLIKINFVYKRDYFDGESRNGSLLLGLSSITLVLHYVHGLAHSTHSLNFVFLYICNLMFLYLYYLVLQINITKDIKMLCSSAWSPTLEK